MWGAHATWRLPATAAGAEEASRLLGPWDGRERSLRDPARPIVYSVGTNGTDDGGSDASAQGRAGGGGGGFWQGDDAVTADGTRSGLVHLRAPATLAARKRTILS